MATRSVTGLLKRANGAPWTGAVVKFRLYDDTWTLSPEASFPINVIEGVADSTGAVTVTLAAGLDQPYEVTMPDGETFFIYVPAGSATTLEELRTAFSGVTPGEVPDIEDLVETILSTPATQALIDHDNIANHGTNDHATIDAHIASNQAHGTAGAIVGTTDAQTISNKTLGAGTKVTRGSDAEGDIWYRAADGTLSRLALGAAGEVLKVNAGATAPEWGTGGGGGGGDIEVQESGAPVVAVASALDFNGTYFDVSDGGSGRAVVTASSTLTGGNGSGSTTQPKSLVFQDGAANGTIVLAAGTRGYIRFPQAGTITRWTLLADVATNAVLDVWKIAAGTAPPTNANTITASAKPTLSGDDVATSTTLTGWTTSVAAGDLIGWEIESNSAAHFLSLQLDIDVTVVNQYTNEDARDAVGAMLTDTASIDLTYDDALDQITATAKYGGSAGDFGTADTLARSDHAHDAAYAALSHTHASTDVTDFAEAAQDAVGGILADSASIDFTYTDATPEITASVIDNTSTQKIEVVKNSGAVVGTRKQLNFIEGSGVTLTITDDGVNDQVDIEIASAAGGGGGSLAVREENTVVVGAATDLDFDGTAFNIADAGSNRATVDLAFGTTAGTPAEGDHTHTSVAVIDFDEAVQDVVGGMAVDSASVDFTYDDGSNSLTAALIYAGSGGAFGVADTPARSDHTHVAADVTDFAENVDDRVAALITPGTGITENYNDVAGTLTIGADIGTGASQVAAGDHSHTLTSGNISDFSEAVDDRVNTSIAVSAPLTKSYNDASNVINMGVSLGTGATDAAAGNHGHTLIGAVKFTLGDPGGAVITTGTKGYISMPFACTITGWRLLADASTTTTLDVWKDTYANYPPVDADRIAGTEKPVISASTKGEDTSLSTWTTSVSAGDVLGIEVEANNNAKFLELSLLYTRTI